MRCQVLLPLALLSTASALDVPDNVRAFYNKLKAQGDCRNKLATGFYNNENERPGK